MYVGFLMLRKIGTSQEFVREARMYFVEIIHKVFPLGLGTRCCVSCNLFALRFSGSSYLSSSMDVSKFAKPC